MCSLPGASLLTESFEKANWSNQWLFLMTQSQHLPRKEVSTLRKQGLTTSLVVSYLLGSEPTIVLLHIPTRRPHRRSQVDRCSDPPAIAFDVPDELQIGCCIFSSLRHQCFEFSPGLSAHRSAPPETQCYPVTVKACTQEMRVTNIASFQWKSKPIARCLLLLWREGMCLNSATSSRRSRHARHFFQTHEK